MSPATGTAKLSRNDRRLLVLLFSALILVLIVVSVLAGSSKQDDTRPTTYNAGPQGAEAAYLMLKELGLPVDRWDEPLANLGGVPADRTTLVLADPQLEPLQHDAAANDLRGYLERGGRVLLTGPTWASLLPGGKAAQATAFEPGLCETRPEGPGPLAQAGSVEMVNRGGWAAQGPQYRIEQRCLSDAVVVRFPVGKGEAVWWSSSMPLTNVGLKQDANLKLLLASLYGSGEDDRKVLFDEYLLEPHGTERNLTGGLPIGVLIWQTGAILVLMILSFSRRKGPLRMPVELPRTSPLEFAQSMGDLYAKARSTNAATEAARRRLMRTLLVEAGLERSALNDGPKAIAEALSTRLRGDWSQIGVHLGQAEDANRDPLTAREALNLVRALGEDEERVRQALKPESAIRILEMDATTSKPTTLAKE